VERKLKDFKGTMQKLISYYAPIGSKDICDIFAYLGNSFAIISPKIMGNMTDQLVNDYISQTTYRRSSPSFHKVLPFLKELRS
jgi:hypothetical protein